MKLNLTPLGFALTGCGFLACAYAQAITAAQPQPQHLYQQLSQDNGDVTVAVVVNLDECKASDNNSLPFLMPHSLGFSTLVGAQVSIVRENETQFALSFDAPFKHTAPGHHDVNGPLLTYTGNESISIYDKTSDVVIEMHYLDPDTHTEQVGYNVYQCDNQYVVPQVIHSTPAPAS